MAARMCGIDWMSQNRESIDITIRGHKYEFARNRVPELYSDRNHRLIYVLNAKSGCTTIKNALYYCDRGIEYFEPERIHFSYFAFWRFDALNCSAEHKQLFDYPNAFIFSVTRHPLHRFISGFVDKLLPGGDEHYFATRDLLNARFNIDLAGDPVPAALAYLEWLQKDEFRTELGSMGDPHFRRQVDCLAVSQGFPIDFVGRLEDRQPILDMFETVSGRSVDKVFETPRRQTHHNAKSLLANSNAIRDAVHRVYKADFEAFAYEV